MKMNLQETKEDAGCGWQIATCAIAPFITLWGAYAASIVYTWFMASISGAPQLTLVHWVGAFYMRTLFTRTGDKVDASKEALSRSIAIGIIVPAVVLYSASVLRLILGVTL